VGPGAVSTTFIAGVENALRARAPDWLVQPDGDDPARQAHLEKRTPKIGVPATRRPQDLVFTAWDLIPMMPIPWR
jgi:hypothetical protein